MRGPDEQTSHMFSYLSPEQRVRQDHPLRAIRRMTDEVLASLSPRFTKMYSDMGRPSIPPEQLLRALLLQSLYTVRSERLLMEEIDYSVLFRWVCRARHGRPDLVANDVQQESRPAVGQRHRRRVL
jgi:transposase